VHYYSYKQSDHCNKVCLLFTDQEVAVTNMPHRQFMMTSLKTTNIEMSNQRRIKFYRKSYHMPLLQVCWKNQCNLTPHPQFKA